MIVETKIKIELVSAATVVTVLDADDVNVVVRKIVTNEATNFYAHPNRLTGMIAFPCNDNLGNLGLRVENLEATTAAALGNPQNAFELCDAMAAAKFFQNIV